jgi:ParB/RepB/Spo0J family partition protein
MSARVEWQPGDVSPEARRAAEAAAEAAGMPLGDWLAETVRSAITRELGSLPAAPEPAEPPSGAPEASVEPGANPDPSPASAPEQPAAADPPAPAMAPSGRDHRARRLSLEAQRVADSGLTSWLATRIEGLPKEAAPVAPATDKAAPTPAISPPAPSPARLGALPAPAASAPATASPPETMPAPPLPAGPLTTLAVADLRPARIRSRRSNDLDPEISALAAAVAIEGVREPILARRAAGHAGSYEVVAGERRRLAAERVGCADLPAVVVEADDAEALMLSLAENLGRADFSPLDAGRAYLRLLTEYRVSPAVLATRLARERSHIVLTLRLLGLPETVRRMIDGGRLAPSQAYALLLVPDPVAVAEQLVAGASPGSAPDPA